MNRKSILVFLAKIAAGVAGLIILAFALWVFFLFGGFKNFEKNRAVSEVTPITSYIENSGGQKLCDEGRKNLEPFSGASGHSYTAYYSIKDNETLTPNIKRIALELGYNLEQDTDYIQNLQKDMSNPKWVARDRAGITYNAISKYLTAHNTTKGTFLYIRLYKDSQVVLTCKDNWERKSPQSNEAILYVRVHGVK